MASKILEFPDQIEETKELQKFLELLNYAKRFMLNLGILVTRNTDYKYPPLGGYWQSILHIIYGMVFMSGESLLRYSFCVTTLLFTETISFFWKETYVLDN